MKTIGHFTIQFLSGIFGILACSRWLSGFSFSGTLVDLLEISLVLALFNIIGKPILKLILGPFVILTFGLIIIFINAFGLWLVSHYFSSLTISFGLPLIYATIIFGIISSSIYLLAKIV